MNTNKYLVKVAELEKEAILESLLTGAAVHVAQNLGMEGMIRSPHYAQALANAARAGFEGRPYHHGIVSAIAGVAGTEAKEMPKLVNEGAHHFKQYLDSKGHSVTRHDHLALRMMTQGRTADLAKLHARTGGKTTDIINHVVNYAKEKHGVDLSHMAANVGHVDTPNTTSLFKKPEGLLGHFKSDNHPLLSNISANITRGRPTTNKISGRVSQAIESGVTGALSAAEPIAGAINYGKQFLASSTAQKIPIVKKTFDWVNKAFADSASSSMVSGIKTGGGNLAERVLQKARDSKLGDFSGKTYSTLKNKAKGTLLNGLAGEADRTAHALGTAAAKDAKTAPKGILDRISNHLTNPASSTEP